MQSSVVSPLKQKQLYQSDLNEQTTVWMAAPPNTHYLTPKRLYLSFEGRSQGNVACKAHILNWYIPPQSPKINNWKRSVLSLELKHCLQPRTNSYLCLISGMVFHVYRSMDCWIQCNPTELTKFSRLIFGRDLFLCSNRE